MRVKRGKVLQFYITLSLKSYNESAFSNCIFFFYVFNETRFMPENQLSGWSGGGQNDFGKQQFLTF